MSASPETIARPRPRVFDASSRRLAGRLVMGIVVAIGVLAILLPVQVALLITVWPVILLALSMMASLRCRTSL